MKDAQEKILSVFEETIPQMSTLDKERLLAFGEGLAFKIKQEKDKKAV